MDNMQSNMNPKGAPTDILVSQFVHEIDFSIELIQHLFRHVLDLQHLHCDILTAVLMHDDN
jgi:hypothetical protein